MESEPKQPLTNKEKYETKRQEKLKVQASVEKQQSFKKVVTIGFVVIILLVLVGGGVWYIATRPPTPEGEIISKNGLHWHAELTIYVKGEKQDIPANIGIGAIHKPVHTHDEKDTIHMEFKGLVRRQDLAFGEFFKNWGKDMRSFGENMKMTVNELESTEYENYIMQDKDKIELYYE